MSDHTDPAYSHHGMSDAERDSEYEAMRIAREMRHLANRGMGLSQLFGDNFMMAISCLPDEDIWHGRIADARSD